MSRSVSIKLDRYGHGERTHTFTLEESYCVGCGATPIWVEEGSDDYYVGPSYFCVVCRVVFTYQGPRVLDMPKEIEFMDMLAAEVAR